MKIAAGKAAVLALDLVDVFDEAAIVVRIEAGVEDQSVFPVAG